MSQNAAPKTLRILAFIANGDVALGASRLACYVSPRRTRQRGGYGPATLPQTALVKTSCSPLPKL